MKQLHIVTAQPNDLAFFSETLVQLYNAKKQGFSHLFRVLVFENPGQFQSNKELCRQKWNELVDLFPEVKFFFYKDTDNIDRAMRIFGYPSLQRPYILIKHFKEYPELEKDAIFYIDGDVLLHRGIEFLNPFIQDDINYLSYTGRKESNYNYICADHFHSKMNNIHEGKKKQFEKEPFWENFLGDFKLTEQEFIDRKDEVGGAQYLLKNINSQFWEDVLSSCIVIKNYLFTVNQKYMKGDTAQEREDNGFQSWCADMWSVLFNLWKDGHHTQTPSELSFSWATDPIEKWDQTYVFHNAGLSPGGFNKRDLDYVNNIHTFFSKPIPEVNNNTCSVKYTEEIKEAKNYFNL